MRSLAPLIVGLIALGACASSGGGPDDGGSGGCVDGERRCEGRTLWTCSRGQYAATACEGACAPAGCVVCEPGTGTCTGAMSRACRADGSGYDDVFCDPVQGMTCGAKGVCEGACAPQELGQSYIGCDYWPTVTANLVSTQYEFAVVIPNITATPAQVTLEGGALSAPQVFTVPAMSTAVRRLPWVPALKACNDTVIRNCNFVMVGALAVGGAYHLRSTAPVTVYQFNPLDFTLPGAPTRSFSNDASLLLPTNTWRPPYLVATWPVHTDRVVSWPSLLAVTARETDTQVTITTRADTVALGGAPAFAAGVAQTVTLGAGDVLQLGSITGDLTGSLVTANRPVAVLGAHYCTYVPTLADGFCDHLEESMFPIDALATDYVVVAPATTTLPAGKEQVIRIVAVEPDTTLTYDPPIAGAATTIAGAGDFVEIARHTGSFRVTSNHRVLVAQYMEGSQAGGGGGIGDPSLALAVPTAQYRREYQFHAPINYTSTFVDIIAPRGTAVALDGITIIAFAPVGAGEYGVARVALGPGPAADGNHWITASEPIGISVYGYGQDTSYWYPGGLNLRPVPVN